MRLLSTIALTTLLLIESSDGLCDDTCDVCLTNTDFEAGTYRVLESGKYCLDEDIEFNPLAGTTDDPNSQFAWFPDDPAVYPSCTTHIDGAFALGFFAAISIETDNVEIDLCQQQISQHLFHYLQQRFFAIIEIGQSPFLSGTGPTTFGPLSNLTNIHIHNGIIGLSSHHGIHSNEASNVLIEDVDIIDFEVGGIQFNGFSGVTIRNVNIGPSATDVQPSGYYSNAKFLLLAFRKIMDGMGDDVDTTSVTFSGGRALTIRQIYDNLIASLDIAFRFYIGESTAEDLASELYNASIELFSNPLSSEIVLNGRQRGQVNNAQNRLPDGSALYGIVMHSRNLAVFGYGDFPNVPGDGENVIIENVQISDLNLKLNEIPAAFFDECSGDFELITPIKGPFADVMDIRKMVGIDNIDVIDNGEDYTSLSYIGNPLSDAQITVAIFGPDYDAAYNTNGQDTTNPHFLMWALDDFESGNYDTLPECMSFMCSGDIMLHTNKGIIGARFDFIENITVSNLQIDGLLNESPLASDACSNYTGIHDGGNPFQLELEGTMGTDVKGIVVYGSDLLFQNNDNDNDNNANTINTIRQLTSNNGDVVGIHLMADSIVEFDDLSSVNIERLISGSTVTQDVYDELLLLNKTPYPNNFFACNILLDDRESIADGVLIDPSPPNGITEILCIDGINNGIQIGNN